MTAHHTLFFFDTHALKNTRQVHGSQPAPVPCEEGGTGTSRHEFALWFEGQNAVVQCRSVRLGA